VVTVTCVAYLNYAGTGRVRKPALDAMRAAIDEILPHGEIEYAGFFAAWKQARATAARLLECDPDEIAMVPNTSSGLHLVADGLQWRPGEEVVLFDRDFPANVQPWRRLADRGVRLRWIPMRDGGYHLDDVADAIGPATRLIAASHVNFVTGFRMDLDALCELAAPHGALVCVDAAQSLGTRPLSLARTPIDFLAAGGHKWLCAPPGTGLFFCRRGRLDELRWAPAGWYGFVGATDVLVKGEGHFSYELPLRPTARRFEGGMPNMLGLVGLAAALEDLEDIGLDTVARRIAALTSRLRDGLAERGYTVHSPAGEGARSGIVTFTHPWRRSEQLIELLAAAGCHVSGPDGQLRASPHYWTTDMEIDLILDELTTV
jgi:cysteine desulfurase / selenocysteine lyase